VSRYAFLLVLPLLIVMCSAFPVVETGQVPGTQHLSGATWASALQMQSINEPLGMYNATANAPENIGHYAWGVDYETQNDIQVTWTQADFIGTNDTAELADVGSSSGENITAINSSTASGLVYL